MRAFAWLQWTNRVGPLTHLKMCVFFSALHCLTRGSSPDVHWLRYFTAKRKSLCMLHIFVSAVQCSCQHSKPCRVGARLISQLKFISTLFVYCSSFIADDVALQCTCDTKVTDSSFSLTDLRHDYLYTLSTGCTSCDSRRQRDIVWTVCDVPAYCAVIRTVDHVATAAYLKLL